MNELFSLLESAHVIFTGGVVIFTVILAIYATMIPPSIPEKYILGKEVVSIFKSSAADFGIMLQSAPVSTRKSNFW